jgi:hypothetical protein
MSTNEVTVGIAHSELKYTVEIITGNDSIENNSLEIFS